LKIRHGAIVANIVFNLYANINDDRFLSEKALVRENLITTTTATTSSTTTTLIALGDPFPDPNNNRARR